MNSIVVHYKELALKGKNRPWFIQMLVRNLKAALALHFARYNFFRVHGSLRITPAMAARITDHVWTIEELITLV